MIKRLSASTLVVLAVASCQQVNQDKTQEKPVVKKEVAAKVKTAESEEKVSYNTRIIDVNKARFMSPEERTQLLGEDWKSNKSLTDFIDPDNVNVKVDMSTDRNVKLNYVKQFALKVAAKNPKGYGAVSISSRWVNEGDKVTFEAIPDKNAKFVRWEGDIKDGVDIKGNEISVVMDKPRVVLAVYRSNENTLSIDSKYGKPEGSGKYENGKQVDWKVESPINLSETERVATLTPGGTIELESDKVIKIDWHKEYKVDALAGDMGSVEGGNTWIKKGETTVLKAVPDDETIAFDRWEGVDASLARTNPLTVTVDQAYVIKAMFTKEQYKLDVVSEHGEVTGTGLHKSNSSAQWSVTSPVATDAPDVRLAADPASGSITMDDNKSVNVKWVKEYLVQIVKNDGTSETAVEEVWIKEGEQLKDYQLQLDPQSKEQVYSWSGDLPKDARGLYPLTFTVTKPAKVIANLVPINSTLAISNNISDEVASSEHKHTETAEKEVPNVRYVAEGTRMLLNAEELKKEVEVNYQPPKEVKAEQSANIQRVDFEGWKNCIRIKTASAQVIISPEAGRVVYFGSPDNKNNLLHLNKDYLGKTVSKAQADEDWADRGGSYVWIAPTQARRAYTGRNFPPAYEVDGAPYESIIINGNEVITQHFSNDDYGRRVQRTFSLSENRLTIKTSLVKTKEGKRKFLIGPMMLTQFIRPEKVTFDKSLKPADHINGYEILKGTPPEIKVNELDVARFSIDIPKENDSEWRVATHARSYQLEFKGYVLNCYTKLSPSTYFPEKNTNLSFYVPETPTDFIEIGNCGEISEKETVNTVIWELEIRN